MPIADLLTPIENRELTIGNQETHPLPRGGTDLIPKLARPISIEKSVDLRSPLLLV
jgi:hypothetical protein